MKTCARCNNELGFSSARVSNGIDTDEICMPCYLTFYKEFKGVSTHQKRYARVVDVKEFNGKRPMFGNTEYINPLVDDDDDMV